MDVIEILKFLGVTSFLAPLIIHEKHLERKIQVYIEIISLFLGDILYFWV